MDEVDVPADGALAALRRAAAGAERLLAHHADPAHAPHACHADRLRIAAEELRRGLVALLDGADRSSLDARSVQPDGELRRYRSLRQAILIEAIKAGSDLRLRDFPADPEFE